VTQGAAVTQGEGGGLDRTVPRVELNGVPVTAAEAATLAVLTYGHFTSMRVDGAPGGAGPGDSGPGTPGPSGSRVKGLSRHLERLVRDCELVFGKVLDPDRVRATLRSVAASCTEPTMLRATVFDPTLLSDRPPSILVTTRPAPVPEPGVGSPDSGVRLRSADYARDLPTVKHLGFFGPLRQRHLAQQAGYDDALFIADGLLCEGPTWNIGVLIEGELIWPEHRCLPGVTRTLVQDVLDAAGHPWSTRPVSHADLAGAQAAFITSSGMGVRSVATIDDVPLPGAPDLLETIHTGYAQLPGEPL
jgi:branched-subunit amino acid aminotransferase/4-amino-4-deoxychorismate lyase